MPRHPPFPDRTQPPPRQERNPLPRGLEDFRRRQEAGGLSSGASKLIALSWRTGTQSAYGCAWRRWARWCDEREVDSFHAPIQAVVDHLASLFEAKLAYSTINGARSAISALHGPIDGMAVGNHPIVRRLMAGVFNERTPTPRYNDTWDVNVVLTHIRGLGQNSEMPDRDLTHKTAMLLALTTASRASELQALDLRYMADSGDTVTFTLPTLTKSRRVGHKPITITLHKYGPDTSLDVVTCVRDYIRRSATWRASPKHNTLLLGIVPPHNPVVTSTISNWLKALMERAGLDVSTYKAHSTRAACTTKANAAGLSVVDIMQRANWKRADTFYTYYHKPTPNVSNEFVQLVLKQ